VMSIIGSLFNNYSLSFFWNAERKIGTKRSGNLNKSMYYTTRYLEFAQHGLDNGVTLALLFALCALHCEIKGQMLSEIMHRKSNVAYIAIQLQMYTSTSCAVVLLQCLVDSRESGVAFIANQLQMFTSFLCAVVLRSLVDSVSVSSLRFVNSKIAMSCQEGSNSNESYGRSLESVSRW
jgi:hypothetical protein